MKILVTKCVCDVCGKEVDPNAPRFVIAFGTGHWDDSEEIPTTTNVKYMCVTYSQVNYAVNKAKKKGLMRDSQERKILKSCGVPNTGIEVTVDESGLVVSTSL